MRRSVLTAWALLVAVVLLVGASAASTYSPPCDYHCLLQAAGVASYFTPTVRQAHVSQQPPSFTTFGPGDRLRFRQLTAAAPFHGRDKPQLHSLNRSITFRDADTGRLSTYVNPLVMFGGAVPALNFGSPHNDVWASSNGGANWKIIAGRTADGHAAAPDSANSSFRLSFEYGIYSTLDPVTQYLYKPGGSEYANDVWQSTDGGVTWRNQAAGARSPYTAAQYSAVAANSQGHVIMAGGLLFPPGSGLPPTLFGNEVWASMNQGKSWRQQVKAAPFISRIAPIGFNVPNPAGYTTDEYGQSTSATDFMYVISGFANHDNLNDVWASSDEGRTWAVINPAGPFPQRQVASGVTTRSGLLVIAAGYGEDQPGQAPGEVQNDVWVSANGGYSWGRCVQDAEWDDRYAPMVAIDGQGYLIVGSGVQIVMDEPPFGRQVAFNDVWRSTISFNDHAAVAKACGVEIPACGVGLRCWPGNDTVAATDGSFVSCPSCPHASLVPAAPLPSSSSGSATNGNRDVRDFDVQDSVDLLLQTYSIDFLHFLPVF